MSTILLETNLRIPKGGRMSPQVAVTPGLTTNSLDVEITRENWPSEGCDILVQLSFDGGNTFTIRTGPLHIGPAVPTQKDPTIYPARIGVSWPDGTYPTHVQGGSINVPAAFNATTRLISPD